MQATTTSGDTKTMLEAAKKYTSGSMFVENIDAFIQYYLDTHPYAKRPEIEPVAKDMKARGWRTRYQGRQEVDT